MSATINNVNEEIIYTSSLSSVENDYVPMLHVSKIDFTETSVDKVFNNENSINLSQYTIIHMYNCIITDFSFTKYLPLLEHIYVHSSIILSIEHCTTNPLLSKFCFYGCTFRGNKFAEANLNITTLYYYPKTVFEDATIIQSPSIQELYIFRIKIVHVHSINLQNLRKLFIGTTEFNTIDWLINAKSLNELDFHDTLLSISSDSKQLQKLQQSQKQALSTTDSAYTEFTWLPKLMTLCLSNVNTDLSILLLYFSHITSLKLSLFKIDNWSILNAMKNMTELCIMYPKKEAQWEQIVSKNSYKNPALCDLSDVHINLQKLYIHHAQIAHLKWTANFSELIELEVTNCDLETIEDICAPKLQMLNVEDNKLKNIDGIERFTHLSTLFCGRNQIISIKGFECCKNLKTMICSDNCIEQVTVTQATPIKVLYIDGNRKLKKINGINFLSELTFIDRRELLPN